jgi:hypothetical protein
MSLWYESLSLALYDCGDNPAEKAKSIIAYLSMPVPRSWWEQALQTGDVRNWVATLCELQTELSKSLDLHEQISPGLLVALAFIDEYEQGKPSERFDDTESKYAPYEYFERAKNILANRPELAQVGELIEKASDQMDQTHGSDS